LTIAVLELDLNQPSTYLLKRVLAKASDVARLVSLVLTDTKIPADSYNLDSIGSDPFAIDVHIYKCRTLPYHAGIELAIALQNVLRAEVLDGWRVRVWLQPESEDIVLDFVLWLSVDVIRISEYRGGREVEMFKDIQSFQVTCWGGAA
jgi:hypothetical protein